MTETAEIPLFPLKSIVFPGGLLLLRIFEPRYLDMVRDCMRSNNGFGVCAIYEGRETGATAKIHEIGTLVKVVDFEMLPDGLLGITAKGERKFKLAANHVRPNQLRMGRIYYLPEEPYQLIPEEHSRLAELLRRIFPEVTEYYGKDQMGHLLCDYKDAAWVGARLVEFLPLELSVKQLLLECQNPLERLNLLYKILHEAKAL